MYITPEVDKQSLNYISQKNKQAVFLHGRTLFTRPLQVGELLSYFAGTKSDPQIGTN